MLCAFDGPPKILRLHGRGAVIESHDPQFGAILARFESVAHVRAIIQVEVVRISDSCGCGVPLYEFTGQRTQLRTWAEKKGEPGLRAYQRDKNTASIDGLLALRWTREGT
jgi:hypothetical protein